MCVIRVSKRGSKSWLAFVAGHWQTVRIQTAREIVAKLYGYQNVEEVFYQLARNPITICKDSTNRNNAPMPIPARIHPVV